MINSKKNNRDFLGTKSIKTLVPMMAVPAIFGQLISIIYNLVDTFFVSQLGTNATAAVGVNSSLERTITLLATLIGSGACSYIARLLGSRKEEEANQVMSTSFFTGIIIGLFMMILGKAFISPLTDFLGATTECKTYSMDYANYVLYAAPFMIGSFILNMCLRSEGSSTYAMMGITVGGILNCFLDPIFIFALDLGVAGASMATAISKVVGFLILLYPYFRKSTAVRISPKFIVFNWVHIKEVVSIGMASFLRSIFSVVSSICLNRVAGGYSTSVLAAISVSNRIMLFPFSVILGFGQGFQPVIGYNWGAKKYERAKESFLFSLKIAIGGGIIVGGVIFMLANPFISIFNSANDPEIIKYGCLALRLEATVLWIHAAGTIINMFYAGIGRATPAMLMSTARQGTCFLPMLFILPHIFGVTGLCATQFAADLLTLVLCIPLSIKAIKIMNSIKGGDTCAGKYTRNS